MKVNKNKCRTCPWRKGSPYAHLRPMLTESALTSNSRICHSTGSNAINENSGKPERICRGARDEQLQVLAGIGFLREATDEAWLAKCRQLKISPDGEKIT